MSCSRLPQVILQVYCMYMICMYMIVYVYDRCGSWASETHIPLTLLCTYHLRPAYSPCLAGITKKKQLWRRDPRQLSPLLSFIHHLLEKRISFYWGVEEVLITLNSSENVPGSVLRDQSLLAVLRVSQMVLRIEVWLSVGLCFLSQSREIPHGANITYDRSVGHEFVWQICIEQYAL